MIRLTPNQIERKKQEIKDYVNSANSADGSKLDANANVSTKNIATMSAELHKDFNIQINRSLITDKLTEMFDEETACKYTSLLESHSIYTHDETSLYPYCVSISMYPFLLNGLQDFGGDSKAPKHLSSYNGGYVNLVFAIASQFAGAVATCEYLMFFDYFARKDYGDDYLSTHPELITQELQQVVYAINQPAAARGFQSCFVNWSIYDKEYFNSMFGNFYFPDHTQPSYESVHNLQKFFMSWFNKERSKAVLTFPVVTAACLNDGTTLKDTEFKDFITTELSEGNAFFVYTSDRASALSSCCRLKNDISDQINDFSYSLGAGGVMTGSLNVITINMFRLAYNWMTTVKEGSLFDHIKVFLQDIYKFQVAFKALFKDYQGAGLLPVYDQGFIDMDKQFLTIGVNGIVEMAELFGLEPNNNDKYKSFVSDILKTISECNREAAKLYNCKFNTEFVPKLCGALTA